MTALDLIKNLREELSNALADLKMAAQYQPRKKIGVYALTLPTDDVLDSAIYPLILIELAGTHRTQENTIAEVLITLGTYKEESGGGVEDNVIMAQAVQAHLAKTRFIGAAVIQPEMHWQMVETDGADFTFSQILAEYKIFGVVN